MSTFSTIASRRFQAPPTRGLPTKARAKSPQPLADARVEKNSKSSFAKVAIGLGLAAASLSACGQPTPPAADAGAYELESPEIVVLDQSVDRIDLARETEEPLFCDDDNESSFDDCDEEPVDYHSVGIHVGHGVVQDLNGNLFVAPQLAAGSTPVAAARNPESVEVKAPLWTKASLERQADGSYQTDGFFGNRKISREGDDVLVTGGLFGRSELMRVRNDGQSVTIVENGWNNEIVQSQGDHLLIQNQSGHELGEVRHDPEAGTYSLFRDHLIGDTTYSVNYSDTSYSRESDNWGSEKIETQVQGDTIVTSQSWPGAQLNSTRTESGWTTRTGSGFGGSVEYHITP